MKNPLEFIAEYFNRFSVFIKLAVIGILALLLLIPSEMIKSTIFERQLLSIEAKEEVGSKWARQQKLTGPILSVPLIYEKEKSGEMIQETKYYHLLPEDLQIQGTIDPELLKRGIYQVAVYRSTLNYSGHFQISAEMDLAHLKSILWDDATISFGLTDLRGIEEEVNLTWNGQQFPVKPGIGSQHLSGPGFGVKLEDQSLQIGDNVPFQLDLKIKGSENLSFVPVGRITQVSIQSNWVSPKFNGNFLPNKRDLGEHGFSAEWKVLELNRNFPQSWTGGSYFPELNSSDFGIDLLVPLDDYQKSMRSAKYALMTIALTFLMFFLVEILGKRKIHPFQYGMVGLALCLFYILLISIAEHSGFDLAFVLSTVAIVAMISLYSIPLFKSTKFTLVLTTLLLVLFGFLFVNLQLQEFALLMGSVGLFLILGATMYLTRNIDWNNLHLINPEKNKNPLGT
ncbi:cell envelope integrity protein CreD [Pararhodonellum marinum]|uniref:cell envelope integrity protein CreD n=1 Tax=Pararhodonellum marinum TaxID=2755358 RepID=UPI0018901E2E|nr:cell envelope integrity protein CreD [Pararhodonellum marinum]